MKSLKTPSHLYATLCADRNRLGLKGSGLFSTVGALFLRPGFLAVFLYRLSTWSLQKGIFGKALSKFLWRLNVLLNACDISPLAVIGDGLHLPHPMGIVIGEATIGRNAKLLQNVALGMRRYTDTDHDPNNYPTLGDDVIVSAGAVLAGGIKIGNCVLIGANAVVTQDVPDYATAVGVPARILLSSKAP